MALTSDASPAANAPEGRRTFGWDKRWIGRMALVVGCFLAAYILLLGNIIAFRHPWRLDLTQERLLTLSPRTLDTLALVQERIRIVIPTFLQQGNPRHHAEREVLERARALLVEYTTRQPLLEIAAEIDVMREAERWVEVRNEFDLSPSQVNRFLLFAGEAHELRQTVTADDIATFEPVSDPRVEQPAIGDFRAEKVLTDALRRLIERRRRPVYFTQDKQEPALLPVRSVVPVDRAGLNDLRRELETAGYDPRSLSLGETDEIPGDCDLLVIVGPFQAFQHEELQRIDRYLQRGGRLFVALGPSVTGIENLLADWGVGVRRGTVKVRREAAESWGESRQVSVRRFSGAHPITRVFRDVLFLTRLSSVRALRPAGNERRLRATTLLETTPLTGDETYLLVADGGGEPEAGDFPVAVAVAQEPPRGNPPPNFQALQTRIVAVGAANFLVDEDFHQFSHRDFALNCFAWLVGEEERASVGGQEWAERILDMTGGFRGYIRWVPTVVFPGIFLFLGAFVYYLRRV